MTDRETIEKGLHDIAGFIAGRVGFEQARNFLRTIDDAIALLKEQEKKEIKLHKKHVITLKRDDEFTMRKLYEAVCETLLDEGELVIVRIDDHEKVDFTFYVTQESI